MEKDPSSPEWLKDIVDTELTTGKVDPMYVLDMLATRRQSELLYGT